MYLISPKKEQYKANLHCHSTISDGKKTPEELKEMYRQKGYSVLAITDHEVPRQHNDMTEKDFLMLTGYEAYIRPSKDGVYNVFQEEVHLNLFAKDPANEKIICYNPAYCKYITDEEKEALEKAGSTEPREYTRDYINRFIETAVQEGYLVAYNHPYWSMQSEEDIMSYEGIFSMEMCNYSSHITNHLEYNGALYDKFLRAGRRIYCHSADDNHNKYPQDHPLCDSFGGFTMILPREFTYESIIKAMEEGEMYSSMGPLFQEISLEENHLSVKCSRVKSIHVYYGSKTPKKLLAEEGSFLTEADFELDENANYIRISIFDEKGNAADTRGYFRGIDF